MAFHKDIKRNWQIISRQLADVTVWGKYK